MVGLNELRKDFQRLKNPNKAKDLARFFKTGKGQYGEGDIFLGIMVPQQRQLVKKYFKDLKLSDLQKIIKSKIHEERLTGLLILVAQYKKADDTKKKIIVDFYLKNAQNINNWDLVDLTAPNILGDWLKERKDRKILYKMARSQNLWERRISILSCFQFIRYKDYKDALKIAKMLLSDDHDLIHKAVGWMLREIGKRDQKQEEEFLKKYYLQMPRTMLRYAIEKFPESKRKFYLKKIKYKSSKNDRF